MTDTDTDPTVLTPEGGVPEVSPTAKPARKAARAGKPPADDDGDDTDVAALQKRLAELEAENAKLKEKPQPIPQRPRRETQNSPEGAAYAKARAQALAAGEA